MYREIALHARVAQESTNAGRNSEKTERRKTAPLWVKIEKRGSTMSLQDLQKLIATLNAKQQEAVAEFIGILKKEQKPDMTFREALDEFVGKHPELLRRLAQ
jgi:hypothetical protein